MRVKVDFDKCDSNGLCEALAPEVFWLDDDDYLQLHKEEVAPDEEAHVRRAAAACPTQAITLLEDD
ncbi:ferredoxin [Nocardioides sp.]|uniref:ferredoxin n=1 Tax=Nocardioides sp. TaxID=35761 RepID=UPI002ED474D7